MTCFGEPLPARGSLDHNLLARSGWAAADLHHLVAEVLASHTGAGQARVWTTGPLVALDPRAAQALAVILHELAVNAARFGALSTPARQVLIEWRESEPEGPLLIWREADGPRVGPVRGVGVG